jgi:hypothetical protein
VVLPDSEGPATAMTCMHPRWDEGRL